jgi:hypothetical protein
MFVKIKQKKEFLSLPSKFCAEIMDLQNNEIKCINVLFK